MGKGHLVLNLHHKRATIGHCGSSSNHPCSLGLLTGTSSMGQQVVHHTTM